MFTSAGWKRQHGDKDMLSNWRDPPRPSEKSPEQGRPYNRRNREVGQRREGVGRARSVRWAAHESGGLPLRLGELIETINPIIRGWGNYYCRSHVRKRFHQLDGWIIRRLWSHRAKRWRNAAWKEYPTARLRTEFKLVGLVLLIPSLQAA